MEEKKFNKGDKVRIDLSTMIVENLNDKVKFDLYNGKVGKVLYTDQFGVAVKIDGGFSDSFAHSYLTTVKKRKGGNAYLKEKLSSLEAKLKDVLNEKDSFADDCKKIVQGERRVEAKG